VLEEAIVAFDRCADVAGSGWNGHLVLLHANEDERRERLALWVLRGLESGEKVVCATAGGGHSDAPLFSELRERRVDVDSAVGEGRLEVLPMTGFYPAGGGAEVVERALSDGFPGVRLSAEATPELVELPVDVCLRAERELDRLCREYPVSAMCQYDTAAVGDRLGVVATTHSAGLREKQLHAVLGPDGLVLSGEVDMANQDLLADVIDTVVRSSTGVLVVDLRDVGFLTVAGGRVLARGTERFRARGGRLRLVDPAPHVLRVLRMFGLDPLTGDGTLGGRR
jgi:anti-sigma B factor antagonist